MHLKRNKAPVSWPVSRKGTKFLVVPSNSKEDGIPMLIVLRDILKVGKTRKEAERILLANKIKVNEKIVKDEKFSLRLFDLLSLEDKTYKIILKNKKFALEETKDREKISKVIGKKVLGKSRVQINLSDGRNFISNEKINAGDSVAFNFEKKKVDKIIPFKENSKIIVTSGSHTGEEGKIEKIGEKIEIKIGNKKIALDKERVMAI